MVDLVDKIEALLPAEDKNDILFRLFFGDRKRVSKEEVIEFARFSRDNDIRVTRTVMSQVDKGRWTWTNRKNIRKRR